MRTVLLKRILPFFLFLALPCIAGQPDEAREAERFYNHKIIEMNQFRTDRGLREYGRELGAEFRKKISALRNGDVWVDLGAGDALALKQYLTREKVPGFDLPPIQERARVISIGYVKPDTGFWMKRELNRIKKLRGADVYRELVGDFYEIPQSRFAGASVMTSNMGVSSYVEDFTYVMQKSISSLKQDGMFFVKTDIGNIDFVEKTPEGLQGVQNTSEIPAAVEKNFRGAKGFKFYSRPSYYISEETGGVIVDLTFQKTADAVEFPNFRVTYFKAALPPDRQMILDPRSRVGELQAIFKSEEARFPAAQAMNQSLPQPVSCSQNFINTLIQAFSKKANP